MEVREGDDLFLRWNRGRVREVKLPLQDRAEGAWPHQTLRKGEGCVIFLSVSVGPGAV